MKALEATNGTTLEKNGQILRVAYAKSILGPGSGTLGPSQSSSLAAAAIEAAAFSQQVFEDIFSFNDDVSEDVCTVEKMILGAINIKHSFSVLETTI